MNSFRSNVILDYIKSNTFDLSNVCYKNDSIAIIVETRPIDNLEWVIKNIIHHTHFKVRIYCSNRNKDMVEHLPIEIIIIDDINIKQYNKLLTSYDFWNSIQEENVLIFQSDSFIINSNICELFTYDYIGALWQWCKGGNTKYNKGGNGGLSFRKKSKMLQIISRCVYNGDMNEDMYFALGFNNVEAYLPTDDIKILFCCECIFNDKTYAIHACDKYLNDQIITKILCN